jgi:hypothetical protein
VARSLGPSRTRLQGKRGIGGASAAGWTPLQLTNLRLDISASNVTNVGGDFTDVAIDQSGAGNNLSAAAAANRLPWVSTGYNGGSKPYWAPTNAGVDWLRNTAFDWGAATFTDLTVIIVGAVVTPGAHCWASYGAGNRPAFNLGPSGTGYNKFQCIAAGAVNSFTTTDNIQHRMWWMRWNGATQSVGQNITQEDSDANASAALSTGATFSLNATSTGAAPSTSQIARVLVMRSSITADELAELYAYLQAEGYGI